MAEEVPDETNQVDDNVSCNVILFMHLNASVFHVITQQDVTEGKNHLKDLLNDSLNFDADGYPVRIRFPGESSANLRCRFGTDVTTKVCNYTCLALFDRLILQNLYQYAFAFSNTERKFLIYTLSPRRVVPCCDQTQLSNGQFGATFAVEEDEDNGIDPEVLFIPTSSTYSTEEVCIIIEFFTLYG